ncbi:MAG: hypothetical protein CYG59_17180 [Chloroflexi bacterium]|nr:MAG: hypothetical protein CYG59_17180 [Chloroflexota bacterium]
MSQYDQRITTYFGDAVLRAGFMPLPHLLMRHYRELGLQTDHAMFVMQLMEITWDLAQPPTTMKKIADRMGVSVRTVQRYSEYLAARALVVIYEQFEHGAQIENGYDLSPLFARLAELAPEPPLNGTPRERRRRGTPGSASPSPPHSTKPSLPVQPLPAPPNARDSRDVLPGDRCDIPPGDSSVRGWNDSYVTAPPDAAISPTLSRSSPFKRIKNPLKKHQEKGGAGGGATDNLMVQRYRDQQHQAADSWSLRGKQRLTAEHIELTGTLLEQFGVHTNIALAVAPTLAPAEAWSLGAYACAARLGPAWIAKQVFDFDTKKPRMSMLARRYDHIGQQLAMLPMSTALELLALIDTCCPARPEDVVQHSFYQALSPSVRLVARALWQLMNELRHGHVPQLDALPAAHAYAPPPGAQPKLDSFPVNQELWPNVLELLAPQVSRAELETWFNETCLLRLDNDEAVIGTPNVFVREYLRQHYVNMIGRQLEQVVGRTLQVQVVVGAGLGRYTT